jgi:hypothetical protein
LQWLQDPSELNGDNMSSIKCEASRHFRSKNEELSERQNNGSNVWKALKTIGK